MWETTVFAYVCCWERSGCGTRSQANKHREDSDRLVRVPHPSTLLGLASLPVLCLGQTVHTQEEALPKPSIRAEPGPVIPLGQPVTIVCHSPAWAEVFRLEDEDRSVHGDQTVTIPHDFNGTEARFHIRAVSEDTARSYYCRYRKGHSWSEPSEILELKVAASASQNYTVGNYVRIGLAGVVLLILVGILAEAAHSWHRWPHRPQGWTQESERQRN
ncbi:leukocyte-associated immunoglobulin-like receptor 2 isoform X2 [Artibeus jamaicensis]|uniref:leukocyte-associated immunoglobulin-like receptor 2 isoform X2 n=1 Tax=Artibeus jamaicensis TaxID=9417 RepID=UPI00235A9BEA|nr:leukocyte-associated immunoglobulin-like receptor 2 isoform X2 [Artibeus jamaicensis]